MTQARTSGTGHGPAPPLTLSLPVDPSALSGARRALDEWLVGSGVSRRDVDDVLIAANEACMNAVEHSGTPPQHKIRLAARQDSGRLRVEVRDLGRWREPTERSDRGHGMNLMRELTDELAIEREADGTRVVMEKTLTFAEAPPRAPAGEVAVTAEWTEGVCLAMLSGEVDLASVERVEASIDSATGEDAGALVLDLSGVGYLDSAGVHMLYRLGHRRRTAGMQTCIVAPPGAVRRVLELVHVEAAIPLADTVETAVDRVERQRSA